jgi:hypothetical protein
MMTKAVLPAILKALRVTIIFGVFKRHIVKLIVIGNKKVIWMKATAHTMIIE